MTYETKAANLPSPPKHLRNKSAMEIVRYLQDHFMVDYDTDFRQVPLNKSTEYMIAVSVALFDPEDWKNPIKAWFPKCGDEWAKAAIIWYHGTEPRSNGYWVYSPGYQC